MAPSERRVNMKAVFSAAALQLMEHEKAPTHACSVLAGLLDHAPDDAHVFDVLANSFRVSQNCGLPPGVAGIPGKALLSRAYVQYTAAYPRVEPEGITDEQRKATKAAAIEEWTDLSELLGNAVIMLMSRLSEADN